MFDPIAIPRLVLLCFCVAITAAIIIIERSRRIDRARYRAASENTAQAAGFMLTEYTSLAREKRAVLEDALWIAVACGCDRSPIQNIRAHLEAVYQQLPVTERAHIDNLARRGRMPTCTASCSASDCSYDRRRRSVACGDQTSRGCEGCPFLDGCAAGHCRHEHTGPAKPREEASAVDARRLCPSTCSDTHEEPSAA